MSNYILIKRIEAAPTKSGRIKHYYTVRHIHTFGASIHGRFKKLEEAEKRAIVLAKKYNCSVISE